MQHPRLSLILKNLCRTYVHVAARRMGTTTQDGYDHILLLFYQGGMLPHGLQPCDQFNLSHILCVAKLSIYGKMGFHFLAQYSPPDAVIV